MGGRSSLDRDAVHLDSSHIDEPAPTVSTAGRQIGEPDLIYLAQVRLLDPRSPRHHAVDVETQPANRIQQPGTPEERTELIANSLCRKSVEFADGAPSV